MDRVAFFVAPVIAGAAVSHDDLVLTAADGNEFAAFLANERVMWAKVIKQSGAKAD